jgi:tRNA threonylcarbamoyladenosine biosynthesis protein TsaB
LHNFFGFFASGFSLYGVFACILFEGRSDTIHCWTLVRILGLETSTREGSVAVAEGERTLAAERIPADLLHSASILPELDTMLRREGLRLADLDGIAVGIGPGSFTGIRLGVAIARGLSAATGLPLRGIGSFDILLGGFQGKAKRVCPLVSAHSYGCYTALYEKRDASFTCVRGPWVSQPDELKKVLEGKLFFLGPDLSRFEERLARVFGSRASFDRRDTFPRADVAARLYSRAKPPNGGTAEEISPLYILPGVKREKV